MIRKQLYIGVEQERKLRRLALRWSCSEAEVVRRAVDRLEEPEDTVLGRLRAAGLLVEPGDDPDLPKTPEDIAELDRRFEEWVRQRHTPIGLSEAVTCWPTRREAAFV